MAWLIDNRDRQLWYAGFRRRERLITCLLTLYLCFFVGLRTWGNDTVTYLQIYEQMPLWQDFWKTDRYDFAGGMGFYMLTSLLKTWGLSPQDYLMFYAFATIIPYVMFVRRYSDTMMFGMFLMVATGFYTFPMAAIKQCMATGLCLLSLNAALDRKWLRYLMLVGLATLFHPYAVVYLLVPFLMFRPWTPWTFLYVAVFMAAGFYLETLLGTVLDITDMMGANYDETTFTGEGVNVFRVAVSFVPLVLALLYGKPLFRNSSRKDSLMFNMAMVNALIMFVGMFGTANYFARLANYFLPGQIITIPWILHRVHSRNRVWLKTGCIVGFMGYLVYEYGIIRPFDSSYSQMPLWDYLITLF